MDGVTLAVGTALVLAMGNVVPAWLLAWGLAGGDGEPSTPLHGLLGLVTALAAPLSVWLLLAHLPTWGRGFAVAATVAVAAGSMAWASLHPDGPWWPVWGLLALLAVGVPVLLATTTTVRPVSWLPVAVGTIPVLAATVAAISARTVWDGGQDEWTPGVLAAGAALVAQPVLLAALAGS